MLMMTAHVHQAMLQAVMARALTIAAAPLVVATTLHAVLKIQPVIALRDKYVKKVYAKTSTAPTHSSSPMKACKQL